MLWIVLTIILPFRLLLPYEKFLLAEQKKLLGIGSPKPNKVKPEPGEPSVSILQVSHVLYFWFVGLVSLLFSMLMHMIQAKLPIHFSYMTTWRSHMGQLLGFVYIGLVRDLW